MAGGKRLRPYLIVTAYTAYGGSDHTAAIEIATGWELLHQSMLVHDDIIDHDRTRHGSPNVSGHYTQIYGALNGSLAADTAALLAGDALLADAHRFVQSAPLAPELMHRVNELFAAAVFRVIGGELIDYETSVSNPREVSPDLITELKTASYSFVLPLQVGALMAGASKTELATLAKLGQHAGQAYQLRDDIIGVFGRSSESGKSADGDLREGKRTLLLQYALAHLPAADAAELLKSVGNPRLSDGQVIRLRQLIENAGARRHVAQQIVEHTDKARSLLHELQIPDIQKQQLDELLTELVGRQQ